MFKIKNFKLLFSGKLLTHLGDALLNITLPWYILDRSGSALSMSLYLSVGTFSYLFFAVYASRFINKVNIVKLLYIPDLTRGFFMIALLFVLNLNLDFNIEFYFILLTSIILNSSSAISGPSAITIVPSLVDKNFLNKANSYLSMTESTSSIIGIIFGVIAYNFYQLRIIVLVSSVFYITAALLVMFIRPALSVDSKSSDVDTSILKIMKSIRMNKIIFALVVFALTWNFIYFPIFAIYVPFTINDVLELDLQYFALIQIGSLMGVMVGAVFASRRRVARNILNFLRFIVTLQLPMFALLLVFNIVLGNKIDTHLIPVLSAFTFFFLGITASYVSINITFYIQTKSKPSILAGVNLARSMLSKGSMAISLLVFGLLVDSAGIGLSYFVNIALFTLLVIFMNISKKIKISGVESDEF